MNAIDPSLASLVFFNEMLAHIAKCATCCLFSASSHLAATDTADRPLGQPTRRSHTPTHQPPQGSIYISSEWFRPTTPPCAPSIFKVISRRITKATILAWRRRVDSRRSFRSLSTPSVLTAFSQSATILTTLPPHPAQVPRFGLIYYSQVSMGFHLQLQVFETKQRLCACLISAVDLLTSSTNSNFAWLMISFAAPLTLT